MQERRHDAVFGGRPARRRQRRPWHRRSGVHRRKRVRGGLYGEEPSLTDRDDGDLKGTTDFRDIYHELLTKTVGTDSEPAVGPGWRDIGVL